MREKSSFLCGSKVISKAGNKIKLVSMEMPNVMEVRTPNAMVPPKLENAKMIKPAKSTMEVYMMLFPVSKIDSLTERGTKKLLAFCSCRYLAKNRMELSTEMPKLMLKIKAVLALRGIPK